jgi:hypothetical protein
LTKFILVIKLFIWEVPVEKSVWADKFKEVYSKLPSRENALKNAGECKNG